MKNFPITKDRFIVYFDLMGFKDLVYRSSHEQVRSIMDIVCRTTKEIEEAEMSILDTDPKSRGGEFEKAVVLPVVFSDSIIFISGDNTLYDAKKAIYVASYFLYSLLTENIPVKGALSYGTFSADFEKSSFFGRPLIDAYLLAEETHFYGAVLHNTFDRFLNEIDEKPPPELLSRIPIPMKAGKVTHSYVKWQFHLKEAQDKTSEIIEKFYEGVSGSTRLYVDNTMKVYTESS